MITDNAHVLKQRTNSKQHNRLVKYHSPEKQNTF